MQQNTSRLCRQSRVTQALLAVGAAFILAGCGTSLNQAPLEDRQVGQPGRTQPPSSASTVPAAAVPEAKPLPGAENAGKPGYYTVKPGDTLTRIGLDNGQDWRDLVRWNKLDKPNLIEVGQVLRVIPPGIDASVVTTRPVPTPKVETRPVDKAGTVASAASAASPTAAAASAAAPVAAARDNDDDPAWGWPASGAVTAGFDEQRNKGLAFGGKAGDAVFAAADGRVVYAGSGLRGYGNLVIIKHNNTYLTAYAHNQTLLVKEDQAVRKGQKIAEMGSSDAEQVKLHFEVRKQGKPVDPAKLLPAR